MAKLKDIEKALASAIDDLSSPDNMRKYGDEAAEMIRVRTRLGYGVDSDGADKKKLKPLSPGYVEQRKKSNLHSETSPKRSNLTNTGQMLDSLATDRAKRGEAIVSVRGSRRDGLSNKEVAERVAEGGRPFNNLSKTEQKRISDSIRKDLQALVEKKLTRLK